QSGDELALRQIAEPQPAAFARAVLEIERLSAVLAIEQLHAQSESRRVTRACDSTARMWRTFHLLSLGALPIPPHAFRPERTASRFETHQREAYDGAQNFTGTNLVVNITLSSGTCCRMPISTSDWRMTTSALGSN